MLKQQDKITALYCRLSRDDEYNGATGCCEANAQRGTDAAHTSVRQDSMSIQNQKTLLSQFARDHGLTNTKYFVDDGFSGTNYDRPEFKQMIDEVEKGNVGTVIVKDLSRLGREYLRTGYFTEVFFPQNDVRFIAINDNVDTEIGENEFAPFKNIINEFYAKDVSKKIKSVMKTKAMNGESLGGIPPYGYDKIPPENKKLIPNERAEIVKLMYNMILEGKSATDVANKLNEMKLPIPRADYYIKHDLVDSPNFPKYPYCWAKTMVTSIVANPIYTGKTVLLKTTRKSLKSKKRSARPEDEWITVENTHEALVSEKEYEAVLVRISVKRRSFTANPDNIFRGLVKCPDCGRNMAYSKEKAKKSKGFYCCATAKRYGKGYCTNHHISLEKLYKLVLSDIQRQSVLCRDNSDKYAEILMNASNRDSVKENSRLTAELEKSEKRVAELDILLQKVYEDFAFGRISEARYNFMTENMETELTELKNRIAEIADRKEKIKSNPDNASKFSALISKYTDITELDFELVHTLIEKIYVHEGVVSDGRKTVTVDIYYRFIGNIANDDNPTSIAVRL